MIVTKDGLTVGERIEDILKQKKMKVAELARLANVQRTKLSMVQNDYTDKNSKTPRGLTTDDLLSCADVLGVSPVFLLTGYNEENATIGKDLGLSNDTISTLKSANDQRIQKAIDIMVNDKDILIFLYHFFTDPDAIYESSGVYIKTKSGKRIPNPIYTSSDMEKLNRLKLLDDLQGIRDKNKGGKAK